ncbi:hypothetical protein BJY01DRAFT_249280 [Aspergillus pseudoustus]|uniref:Uncharacterized protein n=1 Tax=Aspergillus pseudoustus TaxID=1810923 RepID=A0ABR4JPU0_9EURO
MATTTEKKASLVLARRNRSLKRRVRGPIYNLPPLSENDVLVQIYALWLHYSKIVIARANPNPFHVSLLLRHRQHSPHHRLCCQGIQEERDRVEADLTVDKPKDRAQIFADTVSAPDCAQDVESNIGSSPHVAGHDA